ncbi:MAG: FixH family protein [Candidatus Eremiobacteraeota bacterium]|nr:FixH family protein [Candidatus Eremiobacteraeota bacterium]
MKKIAALVAATLLIAGCSSKGKDTQQSNSGVSGPDDLGITTAFIPNPPQKGPETMTITLKDRTGALVRGAVVKVQTTMPSMSMSGPSSVAHDNGDGTYSARFNLQYATGWQFAISAKAKSKNGRTEVRADVK